MTPAEYGEWLQIGSIVTNTKGGKSAPITEYGNTKPAFWKSQEPMHAVLEPGAYNEPNATRVNLMLRLTEEQEKSLQELDNWCLDYAIQNAEKLFGKSLPAEQVKTRYVPCVKTSEMYPSTIRVKMNLTGLGATRFWNSNGHRVAAPQKWRGSTVNACVRLKSLWFMPSQFGIVLDLTDAQVTEAPEVCPFGHPEKRIEGCSSWHPSP